MIAIWALAAIQNERDRIGSTKRRKRSGSQVGSDTVTLQYPATVPHPLPPLQYPLPVDLRQRVRRLSANLRRVQEDDRADRRHRGTPERKPEHQHPPEVRYYEIIQIAPDHRAFPATKGLGLGVISAAVFSLALSSLGENV